MARPTLYSRSPRRPVAAAEAPGRSAEAAGPAASATTAGSAASRAAPVDAEAPPAPPGRFARGRAWMLRHERWLWAAGALLLALTAGWPAWRLKLPQPLSIEQIDAAMRESIAKEPLASAQAAAYEAVLPSVVRVVGLPAKAADAAADGQGGPGAAGPTPANPANPAKPGPTGPQARQDKKADKDKSPHGDDDDGPRSGRSVGTGVVIVNTGLILTNLHVVAEAERIMVTFSDGSESEAVVVNRQPSNDLAVLQAKTIPDDLQAATMRSTGGLSPGDQVVAVGFPFGIGPSASAGVISGLKREFRSPQGQRILTNLIQFDAAANPGNSGGPLVTLDGHVVGIVTAIMNPEGHSTFIGIGFAVPIENAASAAGMPPF